MWHSLFEEIQILHNLIFMLQHFIVNNLLLNLPVVEVGPVADLPKPSGKCDSRFFEEHLF